MRRFVLAAVVVVAGLAGTACAGEAPAAAPTTPADETVEVCREAVEATKEAVTTLREMALDLAAGRATGDTAAATAASRKIEATAIQWGISLTELMEREIDSSVASTFTEVVENTDSLAFAGATGNGNPSTITSGVERQGKKIYWACGYSEDGAAPTATAS